MPEKRTEVRYDRGELTFQKGQDGFRRFQVRIARTGVFPYVYQDGSIRKEAKLPEELFSQTTIDSAKGVPITEDHPPLSDSKGLVTPENYKKYAKGSFGDTITVQDGHLCGVETLFDADLTNKIENGEKVEVSVGFRLDIDPTPGELNGERYDCVQRNMRINHIAHVDKGRAGDTVSVQRDSIPKDMHIAVMTKGEIMPDNIRNDSADTKLKLLDRVLKVLRFDADPATPADKTPPAPEANAPVKPTIEDLQKQIADLTEQLKALKSQNAELTTALAKETDEAVVDSKLAKRTLLRDAAKIILPDLRADGLSDRELKLKIIAAKLPFEEGTRHDTLQDVRIDARFEAALQLARTQAADSGIGIDADTVRNDEAEINKNRKARQSTWEAAEAKRSAK